MEAFGGRLARLARWTFLVLLVVMIAGSLGLASQVPQLIDYQGRISSGNVVFNGTGQFKFALVDATGTNVLWSNSAYDAPTTQPTLPVGLQVVRGLYSVNLGDTNYPGMMALPNGLFTNDQVYLRVWFNDGVNGFEQLSPDRRIVAVGYALMAAEVPDASITQAKLAAGALQASSISGTLSAGQLPANVAYKDTDLLASSNALAGQISVLSASISALTTQLGSLSNQVQAGPSTGATFASTYPQDPAMGTLGYVQFSSIPAPDWLVGTGIGQPSARTGHAAVWTGQSFFVWGGYLGQNTFAGAGGFYRPDLDQWQTVNAQAALPARQGHTMVWDGQGAIVWGGVGAAGYLGSGARYDPGSGSWTTLPTGAPSARVGHVGVWTGTNMVIWSGRNASGLLNDGAIYDPISTSWTSLAVTNAPENRYGATAVWAGDRLVVWGGLGVSGELNTGGQLIFSNSVPVRWQPTSLAGAPAVRTGHSAIWTGARMIVWGGSVNGTTYGDGASYDPIANYWHPLSTTNAPSARANHSAVWTGHEMLILNGLTASGPTASGSAYDPVTDLWRPLSNGGGPVARSGGVGVWSGSEFITFGGQSNSVALAALQRLSPAPAWYLYRKP